MDAPIDLTAGTVVDHGAVFDQLPMALAVLDHAGTVVSTNRAWRAAAVDPPDRVAGLRIGDRLGAGESRGPQDHDTAAAEDHLVEGILRVQGGRSTRFDLHYRLPTEDGEGDRWFLFNATANRSGGTLLSRIETTTQEQVHEALVDLAFHDALTSLPNRSLVSDRIGMALGRTNRSGAWTAVVFADLDGFKDVNDRYGHLVGDQVLAEIARRLMTVVRSEDTCGRWGGDEFVLVLELPDRAAIDAVASRVVDALRPPIEVNGVSIQLGASLGAAMADHLVPVDELLRVADDAMYSSKRESSGITVVTI